MNYISTAHNRNIMHGEEFITDNMRKVGYAVISGDQLIVRGIAKMRHQVV